MNYELLHKRLSDYYGKYMDTSPINGENSCESIIYLPFYDNMGGPLMISVMSGYGRARIDDCGSIAGVLFSTLSPMDDDKHEKADKNAMDLLNNMAKTYKLDLDFDEGLVVLHTGYDGILDGIHDMSKVVITMHTVVPHLKVLGDENVI